MTIYRSQVRISHSCLGGTGTNTWHARAIGTSIDQEIMLTDLVNALQTFYNTIGGAYAGGTIHEHDGVWTQVDVEGGDIVTVPGFTETAGGSAAPLPPSQCLVVGWRTATSLRRARGRTFLGPLAVGTLQDNGTPLEASRTTIEGAVTDLVESFDELVDGALGVYSEHSSLGGPVFYDFTAGHVANRFSVLRSRRD